MKKGKFHIKRLYPIVGLRHVFVQKTFVTLQQGDRLTTYGFTEKCNLAGQARPCGHPVLCIYCALTVVVSYVSL